MYLSIKAWTTAVGVRLAAQISLLAMMQSVSFEPRVGGH